MLGVPSPPDFKPAETWYVNVFGNAHYGGKHSYEVLSLPHGISDEHRDLMYWAYERGRERGVHDGEEKAKEAVRRSLGL